MPLEQADIDSFWSLVERVKSINFDYDALVESATHEMANIERNFNAQLLSRTGFVFQEIKELEFQIVNEINERSAIVSNTECIIEANELLTNATAWAGTNSMSVYVDITQRITFTRLLQVYPTLTELKKFISSYTVEPLSLLGYLNPVTRIDSILDILEYEIDVYDLLFESFVDQIIYEMRNFNSYTRSMNQILTESLDETRSGFVNSANHISEYLVTECV